MLEPIPMYADRMASHHFDYVYEHRICDSGIDTPR